MSDLILSDVIGTLRSELPAVNHQIYMNTGSVGPLLQSSAELIESYVRDELHLGRIGQQLYTRKRALKAEVRESVAGLLGAGPEEIALVQNTTDGINLVVSGYDWSSEDEIITTTAEHAAVLLPLLTLRDRYGVGIQYAGTGEVLLDEIARRITAKTKLVVVSHVSYSTGEVVPVAELAALTHRQGIPLLVDGAQSVGAIPVDVKELDVDYYSIPGQKWLLGPEGTGALYVNKTRLGELKQTFAGSGSVAAFDHISSYTLHEDARRLESNSVFSPALAGLKESIRWFRETVGPQWCYDRVSLLNERLRTELKAIPGVEVITPDKAAGLTSFRVEGSSPSKVVARLAEQGIIIRSISELNCVRAAVGFFNTEDELDQLVQAVTLAKHLGDGEG